MGYNRVLGHLTNSQELAVPWQTGQLYLANQVVINTNLMYLCNTQHTSGATFAGDAAYWTGLNPAATVTIAQGGTGQTTKTDAFDALSPTTTAGDIIVYNGTDNVRQGIGTDGQVLIVDTSQPNKLKWSTAPSGNTNFITNGGAEANNTTGWATYAESDAVTFQDAGDTVTLNNHGLANGNQISFTSITSTTGISTNTLYYVISATTNTFQVATTATGSALPLTTNGSGTMVRFAPKTGAGGSANVTIAASNSSPLIGSYSFLLAKDANNREGQGWEYDFTIDSGYQAKVLQISFNYIVSTAAGTFVAGTNSTVSDVTVWIYDVTNGVMIQPSSSKLLSNSTTVSDTFNATFQTASNSTAYRLIFHVSTPSTTAYTLKVDGISVSPSTYVYGTPVTDWQSYTPTITATTTNPTFGTIFANSASYRRVGDCVQIRYTFRQTSAGTAGSGIYLFSLPAGLSINTSKINTSANTSTAPYILGSAWFASGTSGSASYLNTETTKIILLNGTDSFRSTSNATDIFSGANASFGFDALIPVQGWSSSVQTSDSADTRVVTARISGAAANTSAGGILIFPTVLQDTHGAYNATTGQYRVPVSGFYQVSAYISCSNPNGRLDAYVDGNIQSPSMGYVFNSVGSGGGFTTVYANAGQLIDVRFSQTTSGHGATGGGLTFTRTSGPSAIAASETVAMAYSLSANQSASTTVSIKYDVREFDTHNAYSSATGQFTAPISGTYSISALGAALGATWGGQIHKNGSATAYKTILQGVVASGLGSGTTLIKLNAGETVEIRPSTSVTIYGGPLNSSSGAACTIAITKVGN